MDARFATSIYFSYLAFVFLPRFFISTSCYDVPAMNPHPVVRLANYFPDAFNHAIAAARTCYSSKGLIMAEEVDRDDKSRAQRDAIAESTYQAGHHTIFQHATFEFVLDDVSRQFVWSFLHSHPFYNSEQVSQRYVEVKPDSFAIPPMDEKSRAVFLESIRVQMDAYQRLSPLVAPTVIREYQRIYPHRSVEEKRWAGSLRKKEQELARYVLPVATHAYLYHTVSGITLHRYHRLCDQFDTPYETKFVVKAMIEEVNRVDPLFFREIEDSIPLDQTLEYHLFERTRQAIGGGGNADFIKEFDGELGSRISKLMDYKVGGEATLAQAVRSVLGLTKSAMSDRDAIDAVMNPSKNPYFSESLNLTSLSKLTRTMVHPHFTFKKKLSHTADSQDQRHRMTPASRPVLARQVVTAQPDYLVPDVIAQTPQAKELYDATMKRVWADISRLINDGVSYEFAMYLLPNAFPIRFEESGDLLSFHHKWTKRLCYTAQEEIWRSCKEEVLQIQEVCPTVASFLGAPCTLRKAGGVKPFCPEGDRFCGVRVWEMPVENYARLI